MSFYRRLGVSRSASLDEIRRAYWSLSRSIRHTKRDPQGADSLLEIDRAFETLSDTNRRRVYDAGTSTRPCRISRSSVTCRAAFDSDADCGFPAMEDIVGRMYDAFSSFSTVEQPIRTTRVELTPRQANDGKQVPVDVTVQPSCPVCGGRGEVTRGACAVCHGTGVGEMLHQVQLPVPSGVHDGACLTYSVTSPYAAEALIELRIAIQ